MIGTDLNDSFGFFWRDGYWVTDPDECVGVYAQERQGHSASAFRRVMNVHQLCAVDTMKPQGALPTFSGPNGKSRIDKFLLPTCLLGQIRRFGVLRDGARSEAILDTQSTVA